MRRKTKSISFDLTDNFENELLIYVEDKDRGKFSRYIKRLIADDMNKSIHHIPTTYNVEDYSTNTSKGDVEPHESKVNSPLSDFMMSFL